MISDDAVKLSFKNQLGKATRKLRRDGGITLATLAVRAGVSIPTVRLLESGRGRICSWFEVTKALGHELKGRNLPAASHLGEQIARLRKRRGISQRAIAKLVGVTHPTIVVLEKQCRGRLETLDRVLTVLGAGPRLLPLGSSPAFYTHAGNSSAHHSWESPQWLLEKLYSIFGRFDLDPCSPTQDKRRASVRARVHYTAEEDGLSLPWHGTVFVNPPYGRPLRLWTTKARTEVERGHARTVVGLVPARTDTTWWHQDVAGQASVFFLRGRLCFGDGTQPAPFPSALIVWGATPEITSALKSVLPDAWQM